MRRSIEALESGTFDVLVVGAGVQGAWVALRAAQAGCRVALIDRHDFGGATSANSLNILHGGLRYLQHLDFARMRSSIRARREFARQSARLAQPLPCVMPLRAIGDPQPLVPRAGAAGQRRNLVRPQSRRGGPGAPADGSVAGRGRVCRACRTVGDRSRVGRGAVVGPAVARFRAARAGHDHRGGRVGRGRGQSRAGARVSRARRRRCRYLRA
jgi:hypothetical protein